MEEKIDILKNIARELFDLMGVTVSFDVAYNKDNETYEVNVDGGDATGLLIGKKGETLTSIQTILGVILKEKTGEWYRVSVNVGNYREKEEDYLKNLAQNSATRAKETGQAQSLYNLNSHQRRVVHMYLSDDKEVKTESQGEGVDRHLVVSPA